MQPLQLIIQAFGPYAGRESIDFTLLQEQQFLLIHGPTGAGKTTILDAICFALYGDTSGTLREGKQMRSHFALPETITAVEFVFALGSEIYRVERIPEQQRPKIRGTGFTTLPAKAELYRQRKKEDHSTRWQLIASGWQRVTQEVERILGFRSEQFRQVIMLPQGEFRRLLTADSKERQAILEVLFGVEFYRRIEEALREKARNLRHTLENLSAECNGILLSISASSLEELEQRNRSNLELLQKAINKEKYWRQMAQSVQEKLAAALQIEASFQELTAAAISLQELLEQQEAVNTLRQTLARARQAALLLENEKVMLTLQEELKSWQEKEQHLKEELTQAAAAAAQARELLAKEEAKETEREKLSHELARWEELLTCMRELEEERRQVQELRRLYQKTEEKRKKTQSLLLDIKKKYQQLQKEKEDFLLLAARTNEYQSLLSRTRQAFNLYQQLLVQKKSHTALLLQLQQIRAEAERLNLLLQQARQDLIHKQELWYRSQAALLARQLQEGKPCPVCGSRHHPSPAAPQNYIPAAEELQNLNQQINQWEEARDKVNAQLQQLITGEAALTTGINHLMETLSSSGFDPTITDPTELVKNIRQAKESLARAEEAQNRVKELAKEILALQQEEEQLQKIGEELNVQLQEIIRQGQELSARIKEKEKALPPELQDEKSLLKAIHNKRQTLTHLKEALAAARQQAIQAENRLAELSFAYTGAKEAATSTATRLAAAEEEFQQRLKVAGFVTYSDYFQAREQVNNLAALEEKIHRYDLQLNAAHERLARAEAATSGLVRPDLERIRTEWKTAEEARDQAIARRSELETVIEKEKSCLAQLQKLQAARAQLEKQYALYGHLAEITGGRNRHGLTLQRFVLGTLLDEVVLAANVRLKTMSRGRFALKRTLERERSNAAGGLELEVFDAYTGTLRSVKTLSGGETFLATLALALGLADVVQSYSGGIHLETIFIDEGFGTLDSESLDLALRTLLDLRAHGRLVGIISHVAELKERINTCLEIYPTPTGSKIIFRVR